MTQSTNSEIRRRPDGSIDIDHYVAIGRAEHAKAVCAAGRQLARCADIDRLFSKLIQPVRAGQLSPNYR